MPDPVFTVVVATFDRGLHLAPTLQSLLDQTFIDFEVIVVDDGSPSSPTAALPDDPRFRLIRLDGNSGSQSRPNNTGIAAARGRYIAYLGHDDIWMPDHLARITEAFAETSADVVASGCAYHGPPGTDLVWITGIFDGGGDPLTHFFPPSALAHRASLAATLGDWKSPDATKAPVDADFTLRAAASGAAFASTGKLTVHKFAAGHRYLSYLRQTSDEQHAMLSGIRAGIVTPESCDALVGKTRAVGTFMIMHLPDFSEFEPGQIFRTNRANKGIDRPATIPLIDGCDVGLTGGARALDWYAPECGPDGQLALQWSGPSLRPKLLIPFTGDGEANLILHLHGNKPRDHLDGMRVLCRGSHIADVHVENTETATLQFRIELAPAAPTIVEFVLLRPYCPATAHGSDDPRHLGLPMTGYRIEPLAR